VTINKILRASYAIP